MKTKNVVLTLAAVIVATFAFAGEPTSKVAVVKQNAETFKVIYAGATIGKVTLKVYDSKGNELLSESTFGLDKFIRPVNFEGMEEGEYTIEVADASGIQSQKISYQSEEKSLAFHFTKLQTGKYLMSVANEGDQSIKVQIYDGNGELVLVENRAINGNFGLVYSLNNVVGDPTFHVAPSKK